MSEHPAPDQLVRAGDAAAQLGVDPREVYRLIDAGELPGYRLARDRWHAYVDLADVERLTAATR